MGQAYGSSRWLARRAWMAGLALALVVAVVAPLAGASAARAAQSADPSAPETAPEEGDEGEDDPKQAAREQAARDEREREEAERDEAARIAEAAREEREAHRQAIRSARTALVIARGAEMAARGDSRRLDGQRRRAEDDTVPAVIARLEAHQRLADAEAAVDRAERRIAGADRALERRAADLERAHEQLESARLELEERIVRTYKAGSVAANTSLAITLIREAESPGDLAISMKHLEVLALAGRDHLDDAIARVVAAEESLADARVQRAAATRARKRTIEQRDAAAAAIDDTEAAITEVELEAAAARAAADAVEERLLAAVRRRLDAEAELAAVRDAAADQPDPEEGAGGASRPPSADQPAQREPRAVSSRSPDRAAPPRPSRNPTPEQRREWLAAREKALARARSLAPERRRTAADWVCPVEEGRFVNDWGFPRSSDRRHEGTDVFAPLGAEIRAPVAGTVLRADPTDRFDGRRDLGGITVTVEAGDQRFYFAHLDRIHTGIDVGARVAAGDVVGTVGRTGNARGTSPHLHLGWYVEDVPVNPYASLRVACREPR